MDKPSGRKRRSKEHVQVPESIRFKPEPAEPELKRENGDAKKHSEDMGMMSEISEQFKRRPLDEELGIEFIDTNQCKFIPFKIYRYHGKQSPLDEGLAVMNASGLSFPRNMHEVVRGKYIKFGILKTRDMEKLAWRVFDEQKEFSFAVKANSKGLLRSGSKQLMEQIVEAGFPYGIYRPKEIKGGYIAHLVKARQIKREDK